MRRRVGAIEIELKTLQNERAELWRALGRRARLNCEQAEQRARAVRELRAKGLTQRRIAEELAMGRAMVAHYLSPRSKAFMRVEGKPGERSAA